MSLTVFPNGSNDSGASGNGIFEKELTLLISKYIYDRLRESGIPNTMTITNRIKSIWYW